MACGSLFRLHGRNPGGGGIYRLALADYRVGVGGRAVAEWRGGAEAGDMSDTGDMVCAVPGCACGGPETDDPAAGRGMLPPLPPAPAPTPSPRRWPVKRGARWRIWRAYHEENGERPRDMAAARCPAMPLQAERARPEPGPTGRAFGGGPFREPCPCGRSARWLYTLAKDYPVGAQGARWTVEPWPGMEEA